LSSRRYGTNHSISNVREVVVLAAGSGLRLLPLTLQTPKCLTQVNGIPILGRLLDSLEELNFSRVILVVGHFEDQIRSYVETTYDRSPLSFEFVSNTDYARTNNIYSLWLARDYIHESIMIIESDLVFDTYLLKDLVLPDRIAIGKYYSHMNGTSVRLDSHGFVSELNVGERLGNSVDIFKTVNIYSLSFSSWEAISEQLDQRIKAEKCNDYYEVVFSELIAKGRLHLEGIKFDFGRWCEIDTTKDLESAERIFPIASSFKPPLLGTVVPAIDGRIG